MPQSSNIKTFDESMNKFRLASRTVFNSFFHIQDPYENDGWAYEERFSAIEKLLFQKIVIEPASLPSIVYGDVQEQVIVKLRSGDDAPIMINRQIDSGYWDFPLKTLTNEAELVFIRFFDWDVLDYHDNQYVRLRIKKWHSHPEVVGKDALIEAKYVRYQMISTISQ